MQSKALEIKVGLVIFICMVMLVGLLMAVGGSNFFKKTYEVKVRFALTDGLEDNATVRFAGVEIGKVIDIRVVPEEEAGEKNTARVEVILRVDNDLILHRDSKVRLGTLGLMGGKYVSISPGTIESPLVKPGDVLRGEDPLQISELMEEGRKVLANLEDITTDLTDIVSMLASNREDIKETIKNLRETTQSAKEFTRKINEQPNALIWGYKEKKKTYRERREK